MSRIALALFSLCAGAFAIGGGHAFAQSYPTKPVRLVVPFAAGGVIELMGRYYGQKLTEIWKQQVIVDNRAGAGGNIGANVVAKSAPDGYTLLLNSAAQAISAALYRKLPFDSVKDFTPVIQLSSNWPMLVGNLKLPASSVKELIALAKSRPGKLNYGSTGMGSSPHLAGELFKSLAGIDIVHVPYKGDASMTPALIADEVQFAFLPMAAALPQVGSGKLRALAVTGAKRLATLPEVPTVMETGLPEYEFSGWAGIFAPGGTPRDIVNQISADFARVLGMPDVQERVRAWGYEPVGSTAQEFAAKYKADISAYIKIIRDAKVPLVD
jgi:tripartite-type tricarboxylate transporter receptor subunit TctC